MPRKEIHIEDLLTDRNFIQWAKQPDEEQDLYWKHWLAGHPERRDELLLAKELVLRSDFKTVSPSNEAFDEVLQRLVHAQNTVDQNSTFKSPKLLFKPLRVAAALVSIVAFTGLLVSVFHPQGTSQGEPSAKVVVKQNPSGAKSKVQLPDGTVAYLNAESKLSYPSHFSPLSREVNLTGEAFFEVSKDVDRPFTVHSGNLSTTALGTSFNVSAYPNEGMASISLVTGKVVVSERGNGTENKMTLKPGEQALNVGEGTGLKKRNFNYESIAGWKDGLLVFNGAGITQILSRLQRWYGVDIQLIGRPDESWKIDGSFEKQSLERVLDRLAFTKDFTFEIHDKNVVMNFQKPKPE